MVSSAPSSSRPPDGRDQRRHILRVARSLMAEQGAHATSMRQLASLCGLDVATIYYYFGSKRGLLRAVFEDRRYDALLAETIQVDAKGGLSERLGALLNGCWENLLGEQEMSRILVGEAIRGDEEATAVWAELSAAFESAFARWLGELVPDLPGDRSELAALLSGAIWGHYVQVLPLPADERRDALRRRAGQLVAALVPQAGESR